MATVWKCVLPAGALTAAFTIMTPTAGAFFPPVPQPGETVTVVPPVSPPPIVVPPVPPVCKRPTHPVHPCGCHENPENPQTVPEPGTLLLAGSGLALAALRMRRKDTA